MKTTTKFIATSFLILTQVGCSHTPSQYTKLIEKTSYRYCDTESSNDCPSNLPYYKDEYDKAAKESCFAQKKVRNSILSEQMRLINNEYDEYESDIRGGVSGKKLGVDMLSIGLSSVTTIIGGAGVKTILAAIDTGLKGVNSSIDSDLLQNTAIDAFISKMRENRAKKALYMKGRMKDDKCDYSIEAGISDLGDYLRVSTLTDALISLSSKAAADADKAEEELDPTPKNTEKAPEVPSTDPKQPPGSLPKSSSLK
jgi:hypothetical protein